MDWNSAMMWAELPAVYFVPFAGPASLPKLCDNVLFLFLGKFGIFVSGGSGRPMPWVLLNFSVLNTKFFFGFVFRYIFLSVESSPWRMGFDLRLLCDREADYRSLWDCESRFGFPVFISWQKSSRKDSKFWFLTPLGLVDSLIWELWIDTWRLAGATFLADRWDGSGGAGDLLIDRSRTSSDGYSVSGWDWGIWAWPLAGV